VIRPFWVGWLALASVARTSATAAPSSITLSASPNPATYGSPVTLTAIVSPSAATGKVTFYHGVTVIGVATVSLGRAILTSTLIEAGSGSLKAYYRGDATYVPSTSAATPQVVNTIAGQGFNLTVFDVFLQTPGVVTGDFNGDGKADLAGVDIASTAVRLFLGKGDGTFSTGKGYPGGGSPFRLTAADFNGDGKMDLAVIDGSVPGVRMLLGNGDGSFQLGGSFYAGGSPSRLVTGDFNRDGITDLAVTNPALGDMKIGVLLGKGDGAFTPVVFYPIANISDVIALADVNGDGVPDLVTARGNEVEILLGNGDGVFVESGNAITLGAFVGASVVSISSGDFNKDGKTDLVVSNIRGLYVLLGNGDGTFAPPSLLELGRPVGSLAVTDFNGDGNDDVVVTLGYPDPSITTYSSFAVLLGDGTGVLELNRYRDGYAGGGALVIGDFNGDGRVDVIEALGADLFVYLGLAPSDLSVTMAHAGNFQQSQTAATYTMTVQNQGPSVTTGQVALAYTLPNGLTFTGASGTGWSCGYPQSGACARSDALAPGTTYPPITLTVNVSASAPPSVTNIATVSIAGMSDPNPANDTASDPTTILQYQAIVFGTLPDQVFGAQPFTLNATATSGMVVTFAAAGACTVAGTAVTIASAGICTITASQAGDSLYFPAPNVVRTFTIGDAPTSVTMIATPNPSVFGAPVTLTATVSPTAAPGAVTFYDGSALLGLVNVSSGTAAMTVRLAATGVHALSARYSGTPPYPKSISATVSQTVNSVPGFGFAQTNLPIRAAVADVAVADFNGDGIPDIVAASIPNLTVLLGDGAGGFGSPINSPAQAPFMNPRHIAVGDFNGDGKMDVVTANGFFNQQQPSISIRLGNGDGTFGPATSFATEDGHLAVADFNGDGIADLAIGHSSTGSVAVLLGKGDGTFELPVEYPVSGTTLNLMIAAGDVNQDGKTDLIAVISSASTGNFDNQVSVLLGNGDGTFVLPVSSVQDPVETSSASGSFALGDLNDDGVPDIVIQNGFSYASYRCSLTILLGNGDGTFRPPARYLCSNTVIAGSQYQTAASGSPVGLVIADFNGDGSADIAALFQSNTGFIQLFPGNGDGTLQPASVYNYASLNDPSTLSAADLNGDGRVDLLTTTSGFGLYILNGAGGPFLRLNLTHSATVAPGQFGPSYSITVSNADGASPTSGAVSVTYLSPVSMAGPGWNCVIQTCTRSDVLGGGSSYPPITGVIVGFGGFPPPIDSAVVFGGGSPPVEALDSGPTAH
jgi:uncharacterized repeat protein (TIGR01451 family)